nr:heterogeneous nuclear ribonucleoprotein A1, A2/B1 homolog [Coffea arabica]
MEELDIKFNVMVSLFNWMQKSKSSATKRSKFRKFLDAFCRKPGYYFSTVRWVAGRGGRARERAGGGRGGGRAGEVAGEAGERAGGWGEGSGGRSWGVAGVAGGWQRKGRGSRCQRGKGRRGWREEKGKGRRGVAGVSATGR